MLIVTEVKTIEVDRDYWEILHAILPITGRDPKSAAECKITKEMIDGVIYHINGKEVVLGSH